MKTCLQHRSKILGILLKGELTKAGKLLLGRQSNFEANFGTLCIDKSEILTGKLAFLKFVTINNRSVVKI